MQIWSPKWSKNNYMSNKHVHSTIFSHLKKIHLTISLISVNQLTWVIPNETAWYSDWPHLILCLSPGEFNQIQQQILLIQIKFKPPFFLHVCIHRRSCDEEENRINNNTADWDESETADCVRRWKSCRRLWTNRWNKYHWRHEQTRKWIGWGKCAQTIR